MKKIIDGRRYDTDTATLLGSNSYSICTDLSWWEETLYVKRTGEYFLLGEGGPATKYALQIDQNNWSGGWKIMPLTAESAKQWAEENLSPEKYEEIFGQVDEDEEPAGKKALNLSLPVDLIQRIRQAAVERGVSVSDLVAQLAEKEGI